MLLNTADAVYLGPTRADAAYLGPSKVWPSGPPELNYTSMGYTGPPGPGQIARLSENRFAISKTDRSGRRLPPVQPFDVLEIWSRTDGARSGYLDANSAVVDEGNYVTFAVSVGVFAGFLPSDSDDLRVTFHSVTDVAMTWRWDQRDDYPIASRPPGNAGIRPSNSYVCINPVDRSGQTRTDQIAAWTPGHRLRITGLVSGDVKVVTLTSFDAPLSLWRFTEPMGADPWPGHNNEPCSFATTPT